MKVTYYLPAHPSYFTNTEYSREEVDRAISMFQLLFKPDKLGEIPEAFVFLTQPDKAVAARFESADMISPDEEARLRWTANTQEFAGDVLRSHIHEITAFLEGGRAAPK